MTFDTWKHVTSCGNMVWNFYDLKSLDQKIKSEFLYNAFVSSLGTNTNFSIDFALVPEI